MDYDLLLVSCADRRTADSVVAALQFELNIKAVTRTGFAGLDYSRYGVFTDRAVLTRVGYTGMEARMFARGVKTALTERRAIDTAADQLAGMEG